jgi:hypothetical protein
MRRWSRRGKAWHDAAPASWRRAASALQAGAPQERGLEGVGCRPMLGREARPPWPHPQSRAAPWSPSQGQVQPQTAPFDSDPDFSAPLCDPVDCTLKQCLVE